jgi:hypothetical protein
MLDRTAERFDVQPSRLVADAGYGSPEMLGWLVDEHGIEPRVKVSTSPSARTGPLRVATSPTMWKPTSMSAPAASRDSSGLYRFTAAC